MSLCGHALVMLFFALALVFIGVLAILSIGKNLAQISSLLRSDYEYSVTMRDPILQDDYYQFEAGISYSLSRESQTSLNAEILMQTGDSLYTTSVDWNAEQLSKYGVAISDGMARRYGLKLGDLLYSKHIVDGTIHEYTIEQILPEVSNIKSFARNSFSEGLIIMGYDDQYAENIVHTTRVYTKTPIDQLSSSASDMPVNIVYRTDEIAVVVRTLTPYLLAFLLLSIMASYGAVYFTNREVRHNMKRLIMPGFANRIVFPKTGYEVMHGPKALDILGGILPVLFAVGLLDIVDGLGAPGKYAKRHDVFIMRYKNRKYI